MKFAIGLGKKTALQAAMEDRKDALDSRRLGITVLVGLLGGFALWTGFDGVARYREESSAATLEVSRAAFASAIEREVKKRRSELERASVDAELVIAVTGFDSAAQLRASQRMRAIVPDLESAEFYAPGLPELIERNLAEFGYAKAGILAEVRERETVSPVQVHACKADHGCLAVASPLRSGDDVVGYVYALMPLAALEAALNGSDHGGGHLQLRQGKAQLPTAVILNHSSDAAGSEAADTASAVADSLLAAVSRPPSHFRISAVTGLLESWGSTGLLFLSFLSLAAVAALTVLRHKIPGLADNTKTDDVAVVPSIDSIRKKVASAEAETQATEAASEAVAVAPVRAEPVTTSGALDRSMFRAYDIRGIVGTNLTPGTAQLIGQAIGSVIREQGLKDVSVGRDGRLSGPELSSALIRGLRSAGCDVIDIGAVPTPVLYFSTYHLNTGSGVMVTGSHNPPDYNGFKIVVGGQTLAEDAIQDLFARIVEGRLSHGSGGVSSVDVRADYIDRIVGDVQAMRRMKVVVDAGNGIAGAFAPAVLEGIGCEVMPLYCEVDGNFPNHHPDPSDPHNLDDLKIAIKQYDADLGLAFDGDGDRLGVVTRSGEIIYPDRTLMLFAEDVLTRNPGAAVIYDVKCTGQLSEHILRSGGSPVMWKTGHSLIKAKMREEDAALAGEMSGHFFFGERWYGFDDGIYSAARLMEILAQRDEEPEAVFATLPKGVSTPELKIATAEGEHYAFMERFRERAKFPGAKVTTIDGVRADYKDGFGLVRCSNTTPSLVLRFDALNRNGLDRIQESFRMQLLAVDPNLKLPF